MYDSRPMISGKVFDPNRKLIEVISPRAANTFTQNWLKWLYACFTQVSLAGVIAAGPTPGEANTVDATNTPLKMNAGTTTTSGILIGTQAVLSRTDISFSSVGNTITSTGSNFTTLGFFIGQRFTISGSASNNGIHTVATVGTTTMTTTEALGTEGAGATDVFTPMISLSDFKLGVQVVTNVIHGTMTWSLNSPDSTHYQIIGQRQFTNNTGSTLNITEVALYSIYAGTGRYFCIDHTLLSMSVAHLGAVTLYYTWTTNT
jgi:hypothetical protein